MLNWILIAVLIGAVLWAAMIYNKLVGLSNRSDSAWSDIDVQLKRRHDLVGNLVDAIEGYAGHERETIQSVVEARNTAVGVTAGGSSKSAAAAAAAETVLGKKLGALMVVVEDYPDLKANENYLDLQRQLGQLEDALQNARRYYNAVVRDLNTRIQSLPDTFVARAAGFEEHDFFELDHPGEAAVPRVGAVGTGSRDGGAS